MNLSATCQSECQESIQTILDFRFVFVTYKKYNKVSSLIYVDCINVRENNRLSAKDIFVFNFFVFIFSELIFRQGALKALVPERSLKEY